MVEARRQARLLDRAGFGPRPGDADALRAEGAESWLARQLAPGPDPALEQRLRAFPDLRADSRDAARAIGDRTSPGGPAALRERSRDVVADVVGARWVRAVHGAWSLREVMIDFWSNHFSVFARKSIVGLLLPPHQAVLERHALGRFEELLLAVAQSPAMLVYLDNHVSLAPQGLARIPRRLRGRGLNENYARELLELHTLGRDAGYTQEDVVETARVLTGWSLASRREGVFAFHPRLHDPGPKRVLGERVPGEGMEEGVGLLRRLARHPATARRLASKLAARFVADTPPPALVERAARRFLESEGSIPELLRVVLLAPELADPERRKLKTPYRFAASAVRVGDGSSDGSPSCLRRLGRLGELPYFARTPDGFPEAAAHWIDPAALLERMALAFDLARGRVPGTRLGPTGEGAAEARRLAAPEFQWA